MISVCAINSPISTVRAFECVTVVERGVKPLNTYVRRSHITLDQNQDHMRVCVCVCREYSQIVIFIFCVITTKKNIISPTMIIGLKGPYKAYLFENPQLVNFYIIH